MIKVNVTGEIIAVLDAKRGNGAKGEWVTQTFVLKEQSDSYPKELAFDVFGQEKLDEFNIKMGDVIELEGNVESRAWQDRWFTSVKAFKVVNQSANVQPQQSAPQPQTASQSQQTSSANEDDSLPF